MTNRRSLRLGLSFLLLVCLIAGPVQGRFLRRWRTASPSAPVSIQSAKPRPSAVAKATKPRVAGEFEKQSALLIACQQLLREAPEVFVAIAAGVQGRLPLIALVADADDHRDALALLKQHQIPDAGVHFLELPQNTMWIRDYGPWLLQQPQGGVTLLDADYSRRGRPLDDVVALGLATELRIAVQPVPLSIDGGNLLMNGAGLAIATEDLLAEDEEQITDEQRLMVQLQGLYGIEQLVLLESLEDEPTGHVDMFATFVSPGVVVVGEISATVDPENSQRLNRNARRLAEVRLPDGQPLRVERIPMPPVAGSTWRSYTNVVYANGALLVPVYPDADAPGRQQALATYARLLPGWKIIAIDSRTLSEIGGGLHCVTMNLAGLRSIPRFPLPVRARPVRDDILARRPN